MKNYKLNGSIHINPFIKKDKSDEKIIQDFIEQIKKLATEKNIRLSIRTE